MISGGRLEKKENKISKNPSQVIEGMSTSQEKEKDTQRQNS